MDIGDRIKELREEKHMTLEELGNKVGVGKSTVRKWEIGMIENMRRDKIGKLSAALGVSPGYIMGWTDRNGNFIGEQGAGGKAVPTRLISYASRIDPSLLDRMLAAGGKLPKENLEAFVQAMELAANACEQFKK